MNNEELQRKYNTLKEKLDSNKLMIARAQANLENAEKARDELLKKILELTEAKTLDEAKGVFDKLNTKLEKLVIEAEALLE